VTGVVVWLTGRPAAGKSTLAGQLVAALRSRGAPALLLDGDEVRAALVPSPGYDAREREHFYLTLGNLATLAAQQGLIAVVAATAHRRHWRDRVRAVAPRFVEVYVATPPDECQRRDPKRLYASLRSGLPGADVDYEPPLHPEVTAHLGADPTVVTAILALLEA
jgi:adenylylsulfate kinase